MATIIKATCEDCGDVELGIEDVQVRVCAQDERGSYVFRCTRCRLPVVKPAEPRVVELLSAAGVEVVAWSLPEELFELHAGAPIDHDDLIDFHRLLETDDWLEALTSVGSAPAR